MFGGSGADTLHAGDDNDRVHGGSGDDLVTGDHGSDRLYGGDGDDRIGLLYDRDTVTGGDGADEFAFISGRGAITDFAPGEDFVNLIAFDEFGSLADVTAVATEIAGDLLLDLGDDRLVLRDTVLSALSEEDFVFA
jgi:Ca2+-binding RTX toxin-like protein